MLFNKNKNEGVAHKVQNQPDTTAKGVISPIVANTTSTPGVEEPVNKWKVKRFSNPEDACEFINKMDLNPEFIYSNTAGETIVWTKAN